MAKTKNKKPGMSDKVRKKKRGEEKKVNPFEIKFNRSKHNVLGRKITKFDKGMPGVSRSKANKKRTETLLVEYKAKTKSNKFVDRRIGENDPEMSVEDKMLQRFAKERQKHHDKSKRFNLAEDEDELTHYGQSLAEIEKFDEPIISDDDEDEDKFGNIDSKIVGSEHFGGFLSKKDNDGTPLEQHKSWKLRMEEIIAKSKKEKHVRQSEREKTIEMTEKLDTEWKELRLLMGAIKKDKPNDDDDKKEDIDDFDKMVRELRFESKGMATDRLKTEEEAAKHEKARLDKLEADRLQRMRGLTDDEQKYAKSAYRSADDLDDGFVLDKGPTFEVAYSEGKLVDAVESRKEESDGDEDEGSSEEDDGSDKSGDEAGREIEEDKNKETAEGDEEDEEDSDSDSDAMKHTSDLESDEDDDNSVGDEADEADVEEKGTGEERNRKEKVTEEEQDVEERKLKQTKKKVGFADDVTVGPKDFKQLLKSRKTIMDAARKELPYTFKAPESYVDLLNTFGDHVEGDQLTIIERLRKCHHPSLAENNKARLETLFNLLVEYFGDLALQDPPCIELITGLVKHLYELCQMSPLPTGLHMVGLVKEKQEYLTQYAEVHGGRGIWPTLDTFLHLKLVSQLFPTSDYHHHVATPAMLYMSQLLSQCPINTRRDIGSALFTCSLILEYTSFSKRFVPEVINFLCGIIFLAIKKDPKKFERVIPPFKPIGRNINFLELQSPQAAKMLDVRRFTLSEVFSRTKAKFLNTDQFRVCAVWHAIHLLLQFATLYKDLPSYTEIFAPVKSFVNKLPSDLYPQQLQDDISSLQMAISGKEENTRQLLVMSKHRPQPMAMFEPKVEESFDGRKKHGGNREFAEKQRAIHKYKKEMKGAAREIRKDTQFLAREKLKEKTEMNEERKRKVKAIFSQLADQEGDYKRLKREKERV